MMPTPTRAMVRRMVAIQLCAYGLSAAIVTRDAFAVVAIPIGGAILCAAFGYLFGALIYDDDDDDDDPPPPIGHGYYAPPRP